MNEAIQVALILLPSLVFLAALCFSDAARKRRAQVAEQLRSLKAIEELLRQIEAEQRAGTRATRYGPA